MTAQHDFPTAGVELRHLLVVSDYALYRSTPTQTYVHV